MDPSSPEEQLLDLIYDAAVDPTQWVEVTRRVSSLTGGGGSVLSRLDIDTGMGSVDLTDFDESVVNDFLDHYYKINPIQIVPDPESYLRTWRPRILLVEDAVPIDDLRQSEFYNDFLRPISAEHGLIVRLGLTGRVVSAMTIGRSLARGQFGEGEIAIAARLQPHMVRAFAVGEKLREVRGVNAGLAAALDRAFSAMLIVDANARIHHANAAAEQLLKQGDVLRSAHHRLEATAPDTADPLSKLIGRAAVQEWTRRSAGSLSLQAPGRRPSLTVTALPLRPESAWGLTSSSLVLVVVTEPDGPDTLTPAALAKRYGATAAESRLALALLNGLSLHEAARDHDTSINTARNQLASLFQKTGTHRQAELVRLLMSERGADATAPAHDR